MYFSLEVLQAKEGDCLILHFDDENSPRFIVIDGGPSGIYNRFLKPRLETIRQHHMQNGPLEIEMVMVSHADQDHILGILHLTNDLVGQLEDNLPLSYLVGNIWFNSFNDIIGDKEVSPAAIVSAVNRNPGHHISACISSTGQGRDLRNNIRKLGWRENSPFTAMPGTNTTLVRSGIAESEVNIHNLKIGVLHPNVQRLKEFQEQWDKDLKKAKDSGDDSVIIASLNNKDTSPFNLSSIVCMVEFGNKKMLLTGDARSDDIYRGLQDNGFLDANGKCHVDLLKFPHHGSDANMKPDFLKNVTADHYVISADGKHHNPDKTTLDMIRDNVKKGKLYLTNQDGKEDLRAKLDTFQQELLNNNSALKVIFRNPNELSVVVDLLDKINY